MSAPRSRTQGERARRRAALLLVPILALSAGATACGSSSSLNGGGAGTTAGANAATAVGANAARQKTSSATTVSTVPVHVPSGPTGPPPTHRASKFSATTQQALVRFADCMRARGIHMPDPNISGPGPVFDPKQMDTKNPHFAGALTACRTQFLTSPHPG